MLKQTLLAGAIALGTAAPSFAAAQPSSVWDHNGSVMELVDEGPTPIQRHTAATCRSTRNAE